VEPFCGGASVLFQKTPSALECINDLDNDVVTFFRVMRERHDSLVRAIHLTPYSRAELRIAYTPAQDDLERARRFFIRCFMGRGTSGRPSGFRPQKEMYGWKCNKPRQAKAVDHLRAAANRLEFVQVECLPALDVIQRYDAPGTLFYVDPPYLAENRSGKLYTNEMMGDVAHRELAAALHALKGMAIISAGESDLYRELYADWRVEKIQHLGEQKKHYTECLWISPNAQKAHAQQNLFKALP